MMSVEGCAATLTLDEACDRTWSVVVIGAGPAGALAAHELARRGCAVLLVDKAHFPRDKACGCCLNGAALAQLEACGLGDLVERAGAVRLRDMRVSGGFAGATLALPKSVALSRAALDAALVRRAVAAGAHFLLGTAARIGAVEEGLRHVALGTDSRNCRASIVVVADGLAGSALKDMPEFTWHVRVQARLSAWVRLWTVLLIFIRAGGCTWRSVPAVTWGWCAWKTDGSILPRRSRPSSPSVLAEFPQPSARR